SSLVTPYYSRIPTTLHSFPTRRSSDLYIVDVETGSLYEQLSDGQRNYDLDLARTNIIGELMDLQAGEMFDPEADPVEVGDDLVSRYQSLWSALTARERFSADERWRVSARMELQAVELVASEAAQVEVGAALVSRYRSLWSALTARGRFSADERWRVSARIERLNELGFDVGELEITTDLDGTSLSIRPKVVDAGHHARRLLRLTGIDAQENQARRLLNDLDQYIADTEQQAEEEEFVAHEWLQHQYEP